MHFCNARYSAFSELGQIGFGVIEAGCRVQGLRAVAGMPRSMVRCALRLIWVSLSSAPARLILRPSISPAFAFGFGDAGDEVVADLGDAGPLGLVCFNPQEGRLWH